MCCASQRSSCDVGCRRVRCWLLAFAERRRRQPGRWVLRGAAVIVRSDRVGATTDTIGKVHSLSSTSARPWPQQIRSRICRDQPGPSAWLWESGAERSPAVGRRQRQNFCQLARRRDQRAALHESRYWGRNASTCIARTCSLGRTQPPGRVRNTCTDGNACCNAATPASVTGEPSR